MYKVIFKLHIIGGNHSSGPGDIWLKHEMELPFPPTDGYGYNDGEWWTGNAAWEERKNHAPPAEISWDNDKQLFIFYVPEDRAVWYEEKLRNMSPGTARDKAYIKKAKEIAKQYIADYGWEYDKEKE